MKIRHKAVPAVYLILKKEGQILLARRCNTGYQDGNYHLPSGPVEESEFPTAALLREAKEEIGIDLSGSELHLAHVLYRLKHDETGDRIDLFFTADTWKGEIKNMEPQKCDDLKWVKLTELPENMTPYIRHTIGCIEKNIFSSELEK